MAVRIYALAKELKIDSKELVEICAKAGIVGKGSALASLSDEEVVKLKDFLSGKAKAAAPPRPAAPSRPAAPAAPRSSVPVLPSAPRPAPQRPAAPPPPPPVEPVEPAAPTPAAPAANAPATPTPTGPAAMRREDYIAPTGAGGRMPMLNNRSDRSEQRKKATQGDGPRPVQRSGPAIKLAPMPAVTTPQKPATREPAPQKPDLRLPADAIRASRAGNTPLADHIKQQKEGVVRRGEAAKRPGAGETKAAPLGDAGGARGRGKPRGPAGAPADDAAMGNARDARTKVRKSAAAKRRGKDDDDSTPSTAPRRSIRRLSRRSSGINTAAPRKSKAVLELPCTVRSFSEAAGVPVKMVQGKLMSLGVMKTITAELDAELAELLAAELGVELEIKREVDIEEQLIAPQVEDDPSQLETRPPVITVLGHVDHGKTSLLDRIIGINVVSGESGGITQHIRAYEVDRNGRKIAFVDTPGHEAFTQMRARGANVTDIAVIVVAADDGVMPQTEEAISHARAAGVPIVVALNKIDLPGIDIQRIYQQLAAHDLLPSEWGGETEVVKTSALTGQGVDDLLETLLTIAELHDYRANPSRKAVGTCLESTLNEGRGVVVTMIVQSGTLRVGDTIVCGTAYGRVKAMYDTLKTRKQIKEAGPSTPINLTGLDVAPAAGERFYVMEDIAQARELAERRASQSRATTLGGITSHVTLENLYDHLGQEQAKMLNVILRADVRGSIEAIQKELTKLHHAEVKVKVLQATVGAISEADVHLADASDAVILGFNVTPDEGARSLAEEKGVQIRRYEIIYKLTEDLRAALEGMLKPERREAELGRALIQRIFTISRLGTIAGCRVLSGNIPRNSRMRVIRDNRVIGDYHIDTLRREKDDVRDVREGLECGIKLSGYNDLREGDILEAYRIEEVARTF